jgi:SOS response regulatory protein OraA/RecX
MDAGYLSDTRYAQARVTELLRRRYGPLRAQADLRSHGVDGEVIDRGRRRDSGRIGTSTDEEGL